MCSVHRPLRRIGALLLACGFLLAGGGGATPIHACPHHQPDRQTDTRARQPAPDAPCTCVGTCHGTATVPAPAAGPELPAPEARARLPVAAWSEGRPPALATGNLPPRPRAPPLRRTS